MATYLPLAPFRVRSGFLCVFRVGDDGLASGVRWLSGRRTDRESTFFFFPLFFLCLIFFAVRCV
ncbi:hypothetical protein CC78DRAFT_210336 [Lojkania enalia]|uniref:Uncharacterized protein n=1 Tax=Lojkania enalia TaxID=147567 RepID=A0A9P4JVA3_9PLEO|nr:hypothetical protein CC78DRAFT_210336 [Didymosphaeria enalia]